MQTFHATIDNSLEAITSATLQPMQSSSPSSRSSKLPIPSRNLMATSPLSTSSRNSTTVSMHHTLKVFASADVWGHYFNSVKKCWEPLLERLVVTTLYEKVCPRSFNY